MDDNTTGFWTGPQTAGDRTVHWVGRDFGFSAARRIVPNLKGGAAWDQCHPIETSTVSLAATPIRSGTRTLA
jgi:hypothetical protein